MFNHGDVIMSNNDPVLLRIVLRLPDGTWAAPWLIMDNTPINLKPSRFIKRDTQEELFQVLDKDCVVFSIDNAFVEAIENGIRRRLEDEEEGFDPF